MSEPDDYVCCIAAINPKKNQHMLAATCEKLGKRLVLVGRTEHPAMADLCKQHGAELVGELPHCDAMQILASARVHALPSWSEVVANANLEACALGVPNVMSIYGADSEFFGGRGIYVHPGDVGSIAHGIETAWDRPRGQWAELPAWSDTVERIVKCLTSHS